MERPQPILSERSEFIGCSAMSRRSAERLRQRECRLFSRAGTTLQQSLYHSAPDHHENLMNPAHGTVYLIGAGPGDPGLITVRGRECISLADVVVYDYLANEQLLEFAPSHAE